MSFKSLRDFLADLERDGQLVRVSEPVSTVLEMTEIQTRLLAEGGPAVLFENPVNADGTAASMPVLINLFGTVERVAKAVTLGGEKRRTAAELREVGELLAFLRQPEPPAGVRDAVEMTPILRQQLFWDQALQRWASRQRQSVAHPLARRPLARSRSPWRPPSPGPTFH